MSETQDPKDFPLFATSRSQKKKKQTASAETSSTSTEQTDPVLKEIRALSTRLGNIDGRFDTIEIHETLSNLESRLMEAENRISTTEDALQARESELSALTKTVTQLQAKVDDLENCGRPEGSTLLPQFLREMIPKWLDLPFDLKLEIERAHRSLGPAPGVNNPPRIILVRFLRYADRDRILQAALKKRQIIHEGKQVRFFQDLSVDVMRKRREFDAVKKTSRSQNVPWIRVPGQVALPSRLRASYVQHSGCGGRVHRDFAR
ncbi:hypothetical protein M9458_052410 [Cirrhinus mrigala]|uniref:L1 transposable element RRM domain-containing protein n=1 Tax=Cirrhinus mrigala TaxID=683832 RepID=A0ABD0MRM7_CIRMR